MAPTECKGIMCGTAAIWLWQMETSRKKRKKKEKNSRIHPSFLCTLHFLAPCWEWSHDSIHSSIMAATSLSTWTRVPPQPKRIPPRVCFATVSIFFDLFFLLLFKRSAPVHTDIVAEKPNYSVARFWPTFFFFFWIFSSHTAVILSKESITFKRSERRSI